MTDAERHGHAPAGWSAAWIAVAVSALAAIGVHAVAVAQHHAWPWSHAVLLAGGWLLGRLAPIGGLGVLLGAGAVVPAAAPALGVAPVHLSASAVAGVLGWILAGGVSSWTLPARWRWPIVTWALVAAATWPLVVGRELDWSLAALPALAQNHARGLTPADTSVQIAAAALALLTSLLLLDALWREATRSGSAGIGRLGGPLGAGLAVSIAAALYQMQVDITWLNAPFWIEYRRAPGLVGDPNVLGAVAALVGPALAVAAWQRGRPDWWWRSLLAVGVALVGVLASGSRTALAGWAIGVLGLLAGAVSASRHRVALGVGVLAVVAAVGAMVRAVPWDPRSGNAVARAAAALASSDVASVEGLRAALADRYGYGPAAESVIARHPWWGVGLGTGELFLAEHSPADLPLPLIPDNAQNWWRQAVVDLGWFGGAAPLAASLAVVITLVTSWRHRGVARALALAAPVLGAGVMLLVSVPTQHPLPQLTIAWLLVMAVAPSSGPAHSAAAPRRPPLLPALVAAACALGLSATVPRPPERAQAAGRTYVYGQDTRPADPPLPAGTLWVGRHAVGVVRAAGPTFVISAALPHGDLAAAPVEVVISDRAAQACRFQVTTPVPVECRFSVPPGVPAAMAQIDVGRTWRRDGTERGALVVMRYVDGPRP